jgi:hypothetical protein
VPEKPAAIDASAETAEAPPAPQPEPWTEERAAEWNAYYDLFIAAGLLLLVFFVSSNKITNPLIWTQLRAGQIMAEQGRPLTTDVFSFAGEDQGGRPWVNIPWAFEWGAYKLYKLGVDLSPRNPQEMTKSLAQSEQVGAILLIAVTALVRLATAYVILRIRRPGPGLWWSAMCAMLALGASYGPFGLTLGGIASSARVEPAVFGLFFFSLEMLFLFRAIDLGRRGALYALVPLFLIWANVDESFIVGLLVLAGAVIGLLDRPAAPSEDAGARAKSREAELGSEEAPALAAPAMPPGFVKGLAILGVCVLICLVNPSMHRIYGPEAALSPFSAIFHGKDDVRTVDQLSFFGRELQQTRQSGIGLYATAYYLISTAIGLGSFLLNLRRFSASRFAMFVVASALWAYMIRFGPNFAIVFAVVVALNGQEWFQDRFGVRGRLGTGWQLWSVGGRAVSIVLIFLCIAKALTGYGTAPMMREAAQFGFGFNPDLFEFEAADYLKNAPIKGRVLNTSRHQGDALVWRAYPQRRSYIDSRHNLFAPSVLREWVDLRNALKNDDVNQWKKLLDQYGVSAVMLDVAEAGNTYQRLMSSLNWIPFYDDGNVVMFGRADAKSSDVAYFKEQRLDPDMRAYVWIKPVPPVERPPTPVSSIDQWFQNRSFASRQPHAVAAERWLSSGTLDPQTRPVPDPAHCLLAIREARTALASKPDDHFAYRTLYDAYTFLMLEESALLRNMKLTPENLNQLGRVTPLTFALLNRYRQQATALNFAIQTFPPPQDAADRALLNQLTYQMFNLYASVNHFDLARDRLKQIVDRSLPGDLQKEFEEQLQRRLKDLDDQVNRVRNDLAEMSIERQASPVELAFRAIQLGMPGIAIENLEEADRSNFQPLVVKPQLLDLYCDTGQPEKALEMLSSGNVDDRYLGTEAGAAATRKARVYLLLGNYDAAAKLWENFAMRPRRFERSMMALTQAQDMIRGEPARGTAMLIEIPQKINTQATWEFELGLCLLESGVPDAAPPDYPEGAAQHLTRALTLMPDLPTRPVIAYYLEIMKKPVPPSSKEKEKQEKDKEKEKSGRTPATSSDKDKPKDDRPAAKDEKRDEPAKTRETPAPAKPKDAEPAKEKPKAEK